MKVTPFETYQTYLSLKSHFVNKNYNYFKYGGKSRATIQSFNKRKDKYFFEKTSRKLKDNEVVDYFVSNFINATDPSKVWIGEIITSGERTYFDWKKRNQSISYIFKQESEYLLENFSINEIFDCSKGHPILLKKFLSGNISPETLVIYDKIFLFRNIFDKKLMDPVWKMVGLKIEKYDQFLNIDVPKFKRVLREILNV